MTKKLRLSGLAARIDAALPQTQCTRCGYVDCAHYAQAVADGEASIAQCPPGGHEGIARLAVLTGQAIRPLDPQHGIEAPRALAMIDEDWCIGCTLCIAACPTDAILGANKHMHTVIAVHCTGCELCVPVCPVDCIALTPVSAAATGWSTWSNAQADHARARYAQRTERLQRGSAQPPPAAALEATDGKRVAIAAALARSRAQREASNR